MKKSPEPYSVAVLATKSRPRCCILWTDTGGEVGRPEINGHKGFVVDVRKCVIRVMCLCMLFADSEQIVLHGCFVTSQIIQQLMCSVNPAFLIIFRKKTNQIRIIRYRF